MAARLGVLFLLLATLVGAVSAITQCEPRYSVRLPQDGQTLGHESRHKFLVVLITSEQITAAALHMAEILHLTKLAHRTLILPRVGNSRIDMREPFSWCSYFDVGQLGEFVNWMTMDAFIDWTQARKENLTMSFFQFENDRRRFATKECDWTRFHHAGFTDSLPEGIKGRVQLIDDVSSRLECFFKYVIGEEERMISYMQTAPADVMVVKWHIPGWFLQSSDTKGIKDRYLNWAPYLYSEAKNNIERKFGGGPYIAIHWRTEIGPNMLKRTSVTRLECAQQLVAKVKRMIVHYHIPNVYFATDWVNRSQSAVFSKSISYKSQDPDLDSAIGYLFSELRPAQLELSKELVHDRSGISGIVDKIICIQAEHFVGLMGTDLCARQSLFTEDIVKTRRKLGKAASNHPYL